MVVGYIPLYIDQSAMYRMSKSIPQLTIAALNVVSSTMWCVEQLSQPIFAMNSSIMPGVFLHTQTKGLHHVYRNLVKSF